SYMERAGWLSIFGLGKASARKYIRSDLRPRSNATQGKKRRHPQGKITSRRLAALLAPYRPIRVCASLAWIRLRSPQALASHHKLLLRGLFLFVRWLLVLSADAHSTRHRQKGAVVATHCDGAGNWPAARVGGARYY